MPELSVRGCGGWVIALFPALQDLGVEIVGGGVQVSDVGAQKDTGVMMEQDVRRGAHLGCTVVQG